MKKINEKQKEKIKQLREQGKSYYEISKIIKVTPTTIRYHLSKEFRDKIRIYNRERYRKMTSEQKKKYIQKKKEYQTKYHNKRYKEDKEFREKHIERAKDYQKRTYKKNVR